LFILTRSSLDQSKRARVKEHRLSENTIGLVCRLPRAQGLTRLTHPILVCAFGEQRRSTSPYAPPLLDLPPNAAYSQTRLDEGALWPVNWS
jgi:hypothetical protein